MVDEEEETVNKERKEKEEDYDINGYLCSVFPWNSFA
jgi:hypothetical protein